MKVQDLYTGIMMLIYVDGTLDEISSVLIQNVC